MGNQLFPKAYESCTLEPQALHPLLSMRAQLPYMQAADVCCYYLLLVATCRLFSRSSPIAAAVMLMPTQPLSAVLTLQGSCCCCCCSHPAQRDMPQDFVFTACLRVAQQQLHVACCLALGCVCVQHIHAVPVAAGKAGGSGNGMQQGRDGQQVSLVRRCATSSSTTRGWTQQWPRQLLYVNWCSAQLIIA